jgi:hypothetical protein
MAANVKCRSCGKPFRSGDPTNIGTVWNPVFACRCPTCGAENRFIVGDCRLDLDGVISEVVDNKYAAKKKKTPLAKRVQMDAVREYWVQQYIAANYERLGFKGLRGPFDSGPDLQVLHRGQWVHAEAEVACDNYIQQKHHQNRK